MSFSEVSDTFSPYTQRFHFYSSTSTADSDNEQEEYTGTPSYSNDESNIEDDISEGMEDSEEEIEEREYNYHNNGTSITTTEDEDDDEMEVSSSETESEDTEEERNNNNSNIQQSQAFDNGNNFNMIRNNNGSSNDNNNNNNILPPIQLAPRNPSASLSTSNINNNRFIGSDPSPFMDRLLPMHSSRNGSSSTRDHRVNSGGFNIPSFPDNFSSPPPPPFRFPNVSHPSPSYPNSTDATVASSLSSTSSLSSSTSNQRKQSPLRFGFPDELQDNEEEEDEDGTSSSASYDAASSRKRARSISNDWSNVSQIPQSSFPQSIQFGSLEPVNRPSINQNLRSTQLSPSPPPPSNRSTGSRISLLNFSPDNEDAHSTPSLSHYSNRIRGFPSNSQSSSSTANSSNNHNHPFRSQSQSQPPFFYTRSAFGNSLPRGNYSHTVPQPLELRRPTSTSNHNGNDHQEYNSNFTPASSDVPIVMYPEPIPQPERRHHHHSHNSHNNSHISGLSQTHRSSSSTSSTTTTTTTTTTSSRWSRDTRGGRAETLSRHIMPNPNFQRRMNHQRNSNNNNNPSFGGSMQEAVRVFASDEEPDTTNEVPESSDNEVNVTTSIPAGRNPWRPPRRHESRQDNNNTRDSHRGFNSRAALAAIAAARSSTAYEYSNLQSTIDEQQNVLARLLAGAGRARSATNRRDATSGPSSSSRNESSRRNISTRGPVRLPEILSHERHHHEERSNEPRSRGHGSRGGQSRNGGRSSSAGSYLHHFIPHPLWGNLIDPSEIEFEEILDLFPWGNGIAANPDNYLDEDEFDSSYEGLLRLCERIGDAKPKGVSEDFIKTLPTQTYIVGKSKTVEERCTICLTDYETNERLRELPCLHDFHQECIDIWFKNSDKCPICRRSVTEK